MTPGVQPVPSGVVGQLASQDASASASAYQMMVDADKRAQEAIDREHARRSAAASAAAASLYPTGGETQQDDDYQSAMSTLSQDPQAASSGAAAASSSGAAAASSSGGKGKGKDVEMQKRLVAKNMGTSVGVMDAQAQALQDAAKKADAQITQAAIGQPVPKKKPAPGRATRKTLKGSVTKGTVSAPVLKYASEVKKINQAESARLDRMSTTSGQEQIVIIKTGKRTKPAPKTNPVKKFNLKDKSSELAAKIKTSVERKGAVVKKNSDDDRAIRNLGRLFTRTDMTGALSSKAALKAAPKKRGRPKGSTNKAPKRQPS
jgi:hypothetical protein